MSNVTETVLSALRGSHDELTGQAAALADNQLTAPSGASDWDVSQVLSHLGSGAVIGGMTLDKALAGSGAVERDRMLAVWARWDAMTPQERRSAFLEADADLLTRYEALDQNRRDTLRFDLGFMPEPVDLTTVLLMRLSEHVHHSWDVRVAFDPAVRLNPDAVPLLLDHPVVPLSFIAKPAVLGGREVEAAVTLSDPERRLGLVLGESASLGDAPDEPSAQVAMPAEAWLRLLAGRLGTGHKPEGLVVEGNVTLGELRAVFPGY